MSVEETLQEQVQSPCVGVCSMDDSTGLCLGCYRTMDEIQQWWDLDNLHKQALVALVSAREAEQFN